jgi:complex III assembly factor LYRM7
MMAAANGALAGFRHLLRAQRKAFKGDTVMQTGAVKEIRDNFKKNRDITDPEEVKKLVGACYEAADFLSTFVVQAKLNERGNYGKDYAQAILYIMALGCCQVVVNQRRSILIVALDRQEPLCMHCCWALLEF